MKKGLHVDQKGFQFRFNFLFFIFIHLSFFSFSVGATFYVDDDAICNASGKCKTLCGPNGNSSYNKLTIQSAIDYASANDTISICEGTYTEDLEISIDGLTIQSNSLDKTKVTIQSASDDTIELTGVNGSTLESVTIKQTDGESGIRIKSYSQDILVTDVLIESDKDGISTSGSNGGLEVQNSTIQADDDGIDLESTLNGILTISDTNITASDDGIITNTLNSGLTLSEVTVSAQDYGVRVKGDISGNILISDMNISSENSHGLYFQSNINDGISIVDSNISSGIDGIYFGGTLSDTSIITVQ